MEGGKKSSKASGSVFLLASGDARIRAHENLSKYIEDSYTLDPPELQDLFSNIPSLAKLAELLHALYETTTEKALTRESTELAELATRHLFNEFKTQKEMDIKADKSLGKAKSMVDYAALLAQNPTDITLAKLQILDLQHQIEEQNAQLESILKENKHLERENEVMNDDKNKLENKLISTQNKHKDELSERKYEYGKLEDSKQVVEDRLKLNADEMERDAKIIQDLKDELEVATRENEALKDRLQEKNQKINELRTELKRKMIEMQENDLKNAKDRELLSMDLTSQSRALEGRNQAALRKLARHIKQQNSEIENLSNANHRAASIIERQNELLDKCEEQLEVAGMKNRGIDEDLMNAIDENEQLKDQLRALQEQLGGNNEELENLRAIVEASVTNLAPQYNVTSDQLPEVCKELSGTRIDPATAKTLQKLNATAEGLAKFGATLARDGHAGLEFLKDSPIRLTQTEKADVFTEMERIWEFLNTISYAGLEEDKALCYLVNPKEKFDIDEAGEAPLSFVLSAILSKFREFLEGMVNDLSPVRDVLPAFDCTDYELPKAVAEYIQQMQPIFTQLRAVAESTLHYHGDIIDVFQCLCSYVQESGNLINILDDDVRPIVGFSGKVIDMGPHLAKVVAEMKDIIDNQDVITKRKLSEAMINADKEKAAYERTIDEMQDNAKKQEKLNNSLKKELEKVAADLQISREQVEDLNITKHESDKTAEFSKMKIQSLNESIEILTRDNKRLESTLEERTKTMEARMKQSVDQERENNVTAVERERAKFKIQQELYEKQLTQLTKKLQSEKAKVKDLINQYNAQSMEHQKAIKMVEQDRDEITTQMEITRQAPNAEIEKLRNKLSDAKAKNKELVAEVTRMRKGSQTLSRSLNSSSLIDGSPRSSTSDRHFVEQLGNILKEFTEMDVKWTRPRIIETVKALIQTNEKLMNRCAGQQPSGVWAEWADDLLHSAKKKYKGGITENEMRQQIGDLAIAAGNRTKLIDMIQRLRDQKALVEKVREAESAKEEGDSDNSKQSIMKSLAICTIFLSMVDKSSSRYVKTEAAPAAVRGSISMITE